MLEHEYALLGGYNRARIGRYLAIVAAAVSAVLVFLMLTAVDVAKSFGLPVSVPPVLFSLTGAGIIYLALYTLFEAHVWKWPRMRAYLRVPDLAGHWSCEGQSINGNHSLGDRWTGEVVIVQSWDRIRVRLKTETSTSNSISAAIIHDAADGFRLLYNYRNTPNIDAPDLVAHRGFAELLFDHDCASAEGDYFNGAGRYTFGTMKLTKESA